MLYDLDFIIAGLILLIMLYCYLIEKYDRNVLSVKQLRKLMFFLILADIFDIITAITISYTASVPLWLNNILNILFFEMNAVCISCFPKYVHAVLAPDKKADVSERINSAILGIFVILTLSTPITHTIFYFDESRKYLHGSLYYLVYILPLYFLVFSGVKVLVHRKEIGKRQLYSLICFIVIAFLGPALQMTVAGNRIVDFFALSIAAFSIITGLETPDFIALKKTLEELGTANAELETNRELLEHAKKREEEKNKIAHELTKSSSWDITLNQEMQFIDANWSDEFFHLLGYEREELGEGIYSLWSDSLHPDDKETAIAEFFKGMSSEYNFDMIYRLRKKNGEYGWYRGTGEFVTDEATHTHLYRGIIQDITDEMIKENLAKEKEAALEELEKSQEALKDALHKAEAADRAKSDFLANMSHEIRTPINAVLGLNELITRETTEDSIKEYSVNVAHAGNALLSLINDILDFSKIEAGRMEIAPFDYELSGLLNDVNNMISVRCRERNLEFNITTNPDIPDKLYGDEVRIRQILINILNNAVKYTDSGSVSLNVDFEQKSSEDITLIMSVTDTGMGIKEENIPLLFESFKRIDLEHNRKREGTGLGLNITKSFVELMGGSIEVKSKYGEGSTFIVRIPQTAKGSKKIGSFNASSYTTKKKKYQVSFTAPEANILIVDDVAINLTVLKGLLRQTSIKLDAVMSGMECLEAIKAKTYDVILLDHMMPEMDGIETISHMIESKDEHMNANTPVIMLTANAILGAKDEYLKAGFTDYLSKPVRPEELEKMLIKYLPTEKVTLNNTK